MDQTRLSGHQMILIDFRKALSIAHDRKGDVAVVVFAVVFVGTRVVLRSYIFLEWILPAQSAHENENETGT